MCITASECRTENEKSCNTDDDNNKHRDVGNNSVNIHERNIGFHDKSLYHYDNFLDANYCHFATLTSPPEKQLIQSFQNMKKSLLEIINYSTEFNTCGLSSMLPLPLHYHELLPRKIQIAITDGKAR